MKTALSALALLAWASLAHAEIIYVDIDATGNDDGTSWMDAYVDLQDALGRAVAGDEIWVAEGTYKPTDGLDQTITFSVPIGVAVHGGYAALDALRDPSLHITTLSGDIGQPGVHGDNSNRVVSIIGGDSGTILDGFRISHCRYRMPAPESYTGLWVEGGAPSIGAIVLMDVSGGRAPMILDQSSALLTNIHVEGNLSEYYGALWIRGGGPLIQSSTFLENSTYHLGAVVCSGGTQAKFVDCVFQNNYSSSSFNGGGLYLSDGTVSIDRCRFRGNLARAPGSAGGAIWADFGTDVSVSNSEFGDNHSSNGGAIASSGQVTATNCTFIENSAFEYYGNPDSTAFGNGGAIYGATLTLMNSIIWGNTQDGDSRSIHVTSAEIGNSLVEGSGGSGSSWVDLFGTDLFGNLDSDPLLSDISSEDYRLSLASPALNAGRSDSVPLWAPTDLDGNPRVYGPSVDMGAYELQEFGFFRVADVPNDQGRRVRVSWRPFGDDAPNQGADLTGYNVFRRIDALSRSDDLPDLLTPAGSWDYIGTVPASGEIEYNYIAPTLCDSTDAGICWSTFFVRAVTTDPYVFFDSAIDSGYSIDNLAPNVPAGLNVAYSTGGNELAWQENEEDDFRYFRVYRGPTPGFSTEAATPVAQTTSPMWSDPLGTMDVFYKVAAVDFAGNESVAASPETVTGVPSPRRNWLGRAIPNPFNPRTTIAYSLSVGGDAKLLVYDLAGRRVRTLVSGHVEAGQHEAQWDGRDEQGRRVASGVYLYRLVAGDFVETKRMVLLK